MALFKTAGAPDAGAGPHHVLPVSRGHLRPALRVRQLHQAPCQEGAGGESYTKNIEQELAVSSSLTRRPSVPKVQRAVHTQASSICTLRRAVHTQASSICTLRRAVQMRPLQHSSTALPISYWE